MTIFVTDPYVEKLPSLLANDDCHAGLGIVGVFVRPLTPTSIRNGSSYMNSLMITALLYSQLSLSFSSLCH